MRYLQLLCLLLALMLLTACATGISEAQTMDMTIVCTSFPCYDFARATAGERAQVEMLIKPGSEVHSYEPTPADILAIANCDLFIYIGGESDAWVEGILNSLGSEAPATLRLFDCVEALAEEVKEGMTVGEEVEAADEVEYDEHIWTSPVNAQAMVRATAQALKQIDADGAEQYSQNAEEYCAEIADIDQQFRQTVADGARREMIFADRFPFLYFVREYGLDYYAAFPSCTAESEASAKTLAFLIDEVKKDGVPVIYTIELSNGKTAQTIAAETGAKTLTFYSIQTLSEADFTAGETYVTLMQRNVEALREGLN